MEAALARIQNESEIASAVDGLGCDACIAVVGGAGAMADDELERAGAVFDALVPLADGRNAAIVDGGTDSGVMRLVGRARAAAHASFPLVGVVVGSLVGSDDAEGTMLEPNHTHFVLVPGRDWGDEARWLSRVVSAIAPPGRSVTVLVNGGDVAWTDVEESVRCKRPLVAVDGSGRAADELAAAVRGDGWSQRAATLAATGLLHGAPIDDTDAVAALVDELLIGAHVPPT